MLHNIRRYCDNLTNEVGMLAINRLLAKWRAGSHKVPGFYSVSPAVSSMRRPMSDPSGESMALTDAFLMLLFPLATQDAICLS